MVSVNVHDAKSNLSRLISQVEAGARVTIARAGKPAALLVPVEMPKRTGFLVGQFLVPDDFDAMAAADIADLFEGSD